MRSNRIYLIGIIVSASMLWSCQDFLDAKPKQTLVVPKSLDHLDALLNNTVVHQEGPQLHEIASDNYYVDNEDWQFLMNRVATIPSYLGECLSYIWDPQAMENSLNNGYIRQVYYANVVLDVLARNTYADTERRDRIEGSALFCRAFAFERLVQLYGKPYSSATAEDLGIVLRTTADINVRPIRATVRESYHKILDDLETAAELLPETSDYPTQPTKAAAYALIARTYLSMRAYEQAGSYATKSLSYNSSLIDYNEVPVNGRPVFGTYNKEIIYFHFPTTAGILAAARAKVSPELFDKYHVSDLRKTLFFQANTGSAAGTYRFRGSYVGRFNVGGHFVFDGMTTAEMLLIRAESKARSGDYPGAAGDLNTLMEKRWLNDGTWSPYEGNADILGHILEERRKELAFRGLRWSDLKRLNEEGHGITLSRTLNGQRYTLPPEDPRWVFLIPSESINQSGLVQNPR